MSNTCALLTIAIAFSVAAVVAAVLFRQHRQLARWRDAASRDPLTGLANRRALTEHLQKALAAGRATSVALLDLDHFKQVNDTHGHGAGDDLLITIAGRLNTVGGPITLIARLGGDEFVLVLASTDPVVLDTIGAAIHAVITGQPISLGRGQWADIGVSIGLAAAASDGTGARLLLHQADAAMYTAKHAGGGIHRHQRAGPPTAQISERPVVRQRDQRAAAQPMAPGDAGAPPAHGPEHRQNLAGGGR